MKKFELQLRQALDQLVGEAAWNLKSGVGTFLTLEFGQVAENVVPNERVRHGIYHLWVELAMWRLVQNGRIIVASGDSDSERISRLEAAAWQDPVHVTAGSLSGELFDLTVACQTA